MAPPRIGVTRDRSAAADHADGRTPDWTVGDVQRRRIVAATIEAVADGGIAATTVEHVISRAGVSRRTFYELFDSSEDCFLAAFDEGMAVALAQAGPAYEREQQWIDSIRSAVHALLALFDERPALARLLVVQSLGGGRRLLARRAEAVRRLAAVVEQGRRLAREPEARAISAVTAEGVVGAALALLHARLCDAKAPSLRDLAGPLTSIAALPYLGAAAARRELDRPAPPRRGAPRPALDPLRELPMRLTYRTIRVLQAVAADPGASNRAIGLRAGIEDQGQTSKLLARLRRLELLANTRYADAPGGANAWVLTEGGAAVLAMSRVRDEKERWQDAGGA